MIVSPDKLEYAKKTLEKLQLKYKVFFVVNIEEFVDLNVDDLLLLPDPQYIYVYVVDFFENIVLPTFELKKLKSMISKENPEKKRP